MKLKYLGTAAAEGVPAVFCECENCKKVRALGGRNIRTRSQALIDDTLLIDFPADTYLHYLMHNFPLNKIKSCLITHSHEDHLYPDDIKMRKKGFSHLADDAPLTFYSDRSGYDMIRTVTDKFVNNEAAAVLIKLFEPFEVEGYTVTALRAAHAEKSSPVVYIIEKDGKSIFYSNDTSEYPEESMAYLKAYGKPMDLISLDCTEAASHVTYVGHMDLWRCAALREKLKEMGVADENTVFVLNHFSHNGTHVAYDEFKDIAEKEGFIVSYDGLELEV